MRTACFRLVAARWLLAGAAALFLGMTDTPVHAQSFRFAQTQHDTEFTRDDDGNEPIKLITRSSGTTFAESITDSTEISPFTYDPFRFMRSAARTDWGVNGVRASVARVPSDREDLELGAHGAYALSAWGDAVRVTSGAPTGVLDLMVRLNGSMSGSETEFVYAIFYRDRPFTSTELEAWLDDDTAVGGDNEVRAPLGASIAFGTWRTGGDPSGNYRGLLPYFRNETVYVASLLEVSALGPSSSAEFFNSAYLGIEAPAGVAFEAASGHDYVLAVPEPSALALTALGLLGIAARRRLLPRS
jgi:hypothetical protein